MAKYLKINGKVSKDKWQSMFRAFIYDNNDNRDNLLYETI